MATVATRRETKTLFEKQRRIDLTPTGLLMEGDYTQNHSVMSVMAIFQQLRFSCQVRAAVK